MSSISHHLQAFIEKIKQDPILFFISDLFAQFPQSQAYLVGGMVRDALLGRPCKDYDLVISGIDSEVLYKFLHTVGTVNLVGKKFGVYKLVIQDHVIDIALPRQDFSFGTGKYKDFEIKTDPHLTIEDDLSRRDFTINAMALDLKTYQLIDPFDGQAHLTQKLIKTVGTAQDRFQEDYTRLLRALRFSCQLQFDIEETTWHSILSFMPHINDEIKNERVVPYELVAKEMNKAFYLSPLKALDLFDTSGAIQELMPELLAMKGCLHPHQYHSEGDVWVHTRLALSLLESDAFKQEFPNGYSVLTVYGVLFHDIAKPICLKTPEKDGVDRIRYDGHDREGAKVAKHIASRLKLSSPEQYGVDADDLAFLVKYHLFLLSGPIAQIKNTTLEKYFFNPLVPGNALLQLIFCDASATIPESGKADMTLYVQLTNRLKELAEKSTKTVLPPPLLSGEDIMHATKISPGPFVGEVKEALREKQLAKEISDKKEALKFVKEYVKSH